MSKAVCFSTDVSQCFSTVCIWRDPNKINTAVVPLPLNIRIGGTFHHQPIRTLGIFNCTSRFVTQPVT